MHSFIKKPKCFVVGGCGFLGSHLCQALVDGGYETTALTRSVASMEKLNCVSRKIKIVVGDFRDITSFSHYLTNVDIIFHLACTTRPADSNKAPELDIAANVLPTISMLDVARNTGVNKIVFFSSGGTVYGIPHTLPIPENHPTDPICSYGIHKLAIEKYLHLYYHLYGLDYTILRISNPYGERQNSITGQGAVAAFMTRVLNKESIEIWGDGSVVRDYLHASDVAQAVIKVIDYSGEHKIFNIGSGQPLSLLELVKKIELVAGTRAKVSLKPSRALDVPANVLDIELACKELYWKPKISLQEGLNLTKASLIENI
ncbi:MAG TPA: hypothetical protein DEF34_07760 [Desulfotomaculum sp.]|nr:MAG: hypothetical protein JL56_03920 [Desulfotomaculum sp. BICA1-6]HBX23508.1 hypothetical protein [Desulfotomaculum sp.]